MCRLQAGQHASWQAYLPSLSAGLVVAAAYAGGQLNQAHADQGPAAEPLTAQVTECIRPPPSCTWLASSADPWPLQVVPVDPYVRPADTHGLPRQVILYQYEVCPFCNKVKAFLDYNKVGKTLALTPLPSDQKKH